MSNTLYLASQALVLNAHAVLANAKPGNPTLAAHIAFIDAKGAAAYTKELSTVFAGYTNEQLGEMLVDNLGIADVVSAADAAAYLATQAADRVGGMVAVARVLASYAGDNEKLLAAKTAYISGIEAAYQYAVNPANLNNGNFDAGSTSASGQQFDLKSGVDLYNGTSGNDVVRGVAGNAVGGQDQNTLNSGDSLNGGDGEDTLAVQLIGGNYGGGSTIRGFETLQIGTNDVAARTFEYNTFQSAYEIVGANTVVLDQITVNENLTVQNVTPTATGTTTPTLHWMNEAGSQAGTVGFTYRQASVAGTADTQKVILQNVNNGVLNIGAGIETLEITSQGTAARNTLLNSANADTTTNAVAADLISSGSLTKVVLNATTELGKVGGRVAASGLTDRVATDGVGDGLTTTAANLLSVGARVTTVDASASTAAVNVQFVAKTDGSATNVTFTGGKGADYVEFEIGNVNATGGDGADTFAFVTNRAGVTNSTFGAGDTIVGGAGTDNIQIGSNGVGTYTIADSEWANKTGVDVVDLRGATNTVTLSSTFVAAADTGTKLTVTTDNTVVGGTAPSNAEYNSVNTVDLRTLNAGQGIKFVGGQGSDRIVLSDTTFTSAMELAGGSNVDANGNSVAGDYDTLTISNSAVMDRTDLANISGFEGIVLTKTVSGAVTDVIELTEAFLLANTTATDIVGTSIDTRVFQIGTAAGANGSALAAGDTVRIDVTDLFTTNNNTVKASVAARQIDVTTLTNAGVTVQYVYNGTTYATLAALTAAVATVGGAAVLNGADAAGQTGVIGSAVGLGAGANALTYQGTAADESYTVTAAADRVAMMGGTDTTNVNAALVLTGSLDGGTGTDTLSLGAAANISGATVSNYENLTLNGAATMTAAQYNGFTGTITAAGGADAVTLTTTANVTGVAAVETYNLSATGNQITLAGATAQAINGNAAAVNDTVVTTIANSANKTIALGLGTDALSITDAVAANWSLAAAGPAGATVTGVETVNLQAGINTGATLTMFNGAATINLTTGLVATQNGGAIALGTGGQTVNVTGGSTGVYTITSNSGADSLNLTAPGGAVTLAVAPANSLVTNFDTITGFRAGTDVIDTTTAVGANEFTAQTIATADTAGLAAALATAVTAAQTAAAANWSAAGDTVMVTISAGTAAGLYIVHNEGAGNGGFIATEDLVIKLVGTVGIVTAADIV